MSLHQYLELFNNNFLCSFTQEFTQAPVTLLSPTLPVSKYATLIYENKLKSNQKKITFVSRIQKVEKQLTGFRQCEN